MFIGERQLCDVDAFIAERAVGDAFKSRVSGVPSDLTDEILGKKTPGDRVLQLPDGRRYVMTSAHGTDMGASLQIECTLTRLTNSE